MDVRALRALVFQVNTSAHGTPVTITVPYGDPVELDAVIWLTPQTEDVPGDGVFRRKEAQQVIVVPRADVPSLPRGTVVVGAPYAGDTTQRWLVDGIERVEADRVYAVLVPAPEE